MKDKLTLGTKVRVTTDWSCYKGMTGTVVETPDGLRTYGDSTFVIMDKPIESMDAQLWVGWPMRFGNHELEVV